MAGSSAIFTIVCPARSDLAVDQGSGARPVQLRLLPHGHGRPGSGAQSGDPAVGDGVEPLLEFDVIGADEPLAPVRRYPPGVLTLPLHDDPAALGEFDGAG